MTRHRSHSFFGDVRGNIAIMTALLMPAVVGAGGLAVEIGYWYYTTLQMQNAADSAVIAAASNGTSSYATEAQTVAALYGFQNGVNNVTVTASNSAACPGGGSTCYSVSITSLIPLYLSAVVGYAGTKTVSGTPYTQLSSTAVAKNSAAPACVLALDPTDAKTVILTGGTVNLNNCNLMVNSSSGDAFDVSGGNITAAAIDIHGNYQTSGGVIKTTPTTGVATVADPYTGLFTSNNVASMEGEACGFNNTNISSSQTISQGVYCGGINVSGGQVAMNAGVYVIEGGKFTVTGGSLTGTGVTIILTKNSAGQWATAALTGGSATLTAPTSGSWAGILFYQDKNDPVKTDTSKFTGGNNTLTGALYFPTQVVDYTGGTSTSLCTQLIGYEFDLTGGSSVASSCAGTGVTTIISGGGGRGSLVQ